VKPVSDGDTGQWISAMNATTPVLVVDDSQTIRLIITKHLNSLGFGDIDVAEDGKAALAFMRERKYALLISDWEMQPMGGEQLLKAVRQDPKCIKLPVIMITAKTSRGNSWLAGADAYLAKPFTEIDFQKAIKTVFGNRKGS
jgi:two-component system, chemotaxis family, chemotaxis protein CheY